MWKTIKDGFLSIITLFMLPCFIGFAVVAAILLLPFALLIAFFFAIKEVITRRKKPKDEYVYVRKMVVEDYPGYETENYAVQEVETPIKEVYNRLNQQVRYSWRRNSFTFN